MNVALVAGGRPTAPRRPQADILKVRGNFCNLFCAWNAVPRRLIFDPYLASITPEERAVWLETHRRHGTTHIVLSPSCAYGGAAARGYPDFDWLDQPERFAALVREMLDTPSADGFGFTPILLLDSGHPGYDERMGRWQAIKDALGDDHRQVIVVPGWELITASVWTSVAYSRALCLLRDQGWAHIGVHLSVERGSFASHPLEPDDPWQGAEALCWKTSGGEAVEVFFYQASAFTGDTGWLNRWDDMVPRFRQGMNGWRPLALCFFEATAYAYWHGWVAHPETEASDMATLARDWARTHYGVTDISYGNGLPWP